MAAAFKKEGWLKKNHAGGEFGSANKKRWFTTEGFQVIYYSDTKKKNAKGHFDLRNVLNLAPSHSAKAGEGAVDISIGEQGKTSRKVMTISFATAAAGDREAWLKLWCSAVLAVHVHRELLSYVDAALAKGLNAEYGTQTGLSRKNGFFGGARETTVLTPRSAETETAAPATPGGTSDAGVVAPKTLVSVPKISKEDLDTPRETPPGTPVETLPPEVVGGGGTALPSASPLPPPTDASNTATHEDEATEETFEITVPEGVEPGARVQATTPSGVRVKLVVPAGAKPGMLLTFQVPIQAKRKREQKIKRQEEATKAAVSVQAHIRGRHARRELGLVPPLPPPSAKPPGRPPTRSQIEDAAAGVALERAATKVQANFRGHTARNSQQEVARVQWLEYYIQPAVAEYDQADALAVSPEEVAKITKARLGHWRGSDADGLNAEEHRRRQWLAHYLKNGDFARAATLVSTEAEAARVLKATALASHVVCRCLPFGPPSGDVEEERKSKFDSAVKRYEWDVAETLAITGDEYQDVAESKLRVTALKAALADGDFAQARKFVITQEEADELSAAQKQTKASTTQSAKQLAVGQGAAAKEVEQAAVRVQALMRGHLTREQQQEERRTEWLQYYAAEGDYENAMDLAVSQREIDSINKLKRNAKSRADLDGTCFSKCLGPKPQAEGDDEGMVVQARVALPPPTAAKPTVGHPPKPAAAPSAMPPPPARKDGPFADAIKARDWALATTLAEGDEDARDVAESQARVEWMETYTAAGKFDDALAVAITQLETDAILEAERKAHGYGMP